MKRDAWLACAFALFMGVCLGAGGARSFYEEQLDRLAANPLCAAACNVLKAVRR